MARIESAGVLAFRRRGDALEVLLVHPGGPYWQRKDDGAWSIPKGEFVSGESAEAAARREFAEETGTPLLHNELMSLTPIKQRSGKIVHPFAVETDIDASAVRSNTFVMEWPPRSGTMREFPEVDRAEWFGVDEARRKILPAQRPIIDELVARVAGAR